MIYENIAFIGPGKMAKAIINGMVTANFIDTKNLYIYGRSRNSMAYFADLGCKTCTEIDEIKKNCSIIFICVKPQNFGEIFDIMQPVVANNNLYISIAAGVTSERIRELLGFEAKVIRVMPNTALQIGEGATALSKTRNVTDKEFSLVFDIFSCAGIAKEIDENLQDAVINVSGSTPAYMYYISDIILNYAKENGISQDVSRQLFAQTLLGCAKMLIETELSPLELIDMVASKGGTTRAALDSFDENELSKTIVKALDACQKRAKELKGE